MREGFRRQLPATGNPSNASLTASEALPEGYTAFARGRGHRSHKVGNLRSLEFDSRSVGRAVVTS
ncbi:MAG: hypothetical protein JO235_23300 [Chroococcidiopsidaceae cyanobacterium CP_BM_RX_35]|nr:hypothetical protein [Chroococcidiopsidaceae cyanobacterium CP_BM_RX_35]